MAQEDGVDADGGARMLAHWVKRLFPAPATKHLCQDAKGERKQHPAPVHLVCHHMQNGVPILASVHPIENGTTQNEWHEYLEYDASHLHSDYKGTK